MGYNSKDNFIFCYRFTKRNSYSSKKYAGKFQTYVLRRRNTCANTQETVNLWWRRTDWNILSLHSAVVIYLMEVFLLPDFTDMLHRGAKHSECKQDRRICTNQDSTWVFRVQQWCFCLLQLKYFCSLLSGEYSLILRHFIYLWTILDFQFTVWVVLIARYFP